MPFRRISLRRCAFYSVLGLLGLGLLLEALYFSSVFLFVSTPLFNRIVPDDPHDFSLHALTGWSFIPGHVHLRGVTIRGEDANVVWQVSLPSVSCVLSLRELQLKQLRFKEIYSPGGLVFEIRLKNPAEQAAYPKSPVDIPVAEKKRERFHLFFDHVLLRNIAELKGDKWDYHGGAEVEGGFEIWPGIEAAIGPATLTLAHGKVGMIENFNGRFRVQIDRFSPPDVVGAAILKYFNVDSEFRAHVGDNTWINQFIIRNPSLTLEEGQGEVTSHFQIHHGDLLPGADFSLKTSEVGLALNNRVVARGSGEIKAEVNTEGGQATGEVHVALDHLQLASRQSGFDLAQADSLLLAVYSRDLFLGNIFDARYLALSLPKAKISRHEDWIKYFQTSPSALELRPGEGTVSLQISAKDGQVPANLLEAHPIAGQVQLRLPALSLRSGGASMDGSFQFQTRIGLIDLKTLRARVSGLHWDLTKSTWRFARVAGQTPEQNAAGPAVIENWWIRGATQDTEMALAPSVIGHTRATVEVKDTEPFIKYYQMDHELAPWKLALLRRGPVKVGCDADKTDAQTRLADVRVLAGPIQVGGGIQWQEETTYPAGAFKVKFGPFAAGVRFAAGKSEFHLFPTDRWLTGPLD